MSTTQTKGVGLIKENYEKPIYKTPRLRDVRKN
jgi:hypothetical protein